LFTATSYNFMNPERRFSQIEEVLSEALIKIDRIEDLATKDLPANKLLIIRL